MLSYSVAEHLGYLLASLAPTTAVTLGTCIREIKVGFQEPGQAMAFFRNVFVGVYMHLVCPITRDLRFPLHHAGQQIPRYAS
jgi:hypothetical protein